MPVPVFLGEGRIDWHEAPVPEPGPGEVLVRVAGNALCGTDRLQHRFGSEVTPGHEASGTVVHVGDGVELSAGERGVLFLMGFCGRCRSCRAGHTNQCLDKHPDLGFERDGGFAPYETARVEQFRSVPDDIDLVDATLLLDVMGTSGHAIERAQRMREDIESVVVTGAGPIGLGVVAMAQVMLGDEIPIVVTDLAPYRLALAERLGATAVDVSGGISVGDACRKAGIDAPDVAFDATGREEPRRRHARRTGRSGACSCASGTGKGLSLKVSPDLIAAERTCHGQRVLPGTTSWRSTSSGWANNRGPAHQRRIVTHQLRRRARSTRPSSSFLSGETGKVVIVP